MSWKIITLALLAALSSLMADPSDDAAPSEDSLEEKPSAESLRERVSMALGHQAGLRAKLKRIEKADVTTRQFAEGFELALDGEPLPFSPEEIREAFTVLQKEITQREVALAEKNELEQKEFLAQNATQEGITTLESGLQYQVLEKGGELAEGNLAEVHYLGTLLNGNEFEASDGERPTLLALDEVIAGFREALSLMPVGARWKVFIPSDLGYGEVRRSDLIGPNELLIFEIELVGKKTSEPE